VYVHRPMWRSTNTSARVCAPLRLAHGTAIGRVCGRSPESRDICHVIWNAGALRSTHEKVVSPIVGGTRNVFVPSITPYFGLNFRRGPCPGGGLGANLEWDGPRCEPPRERQHEEQHCA